jgi:integrase
VVQADGSRTIAWEHLGRLLGCVGHGLKQRFAPMVAAAGLPVADACCLDTPITGRVDGVPWRRRRIAYHEAEPLARHLTTACYVVIAYLSGMRPGEALTLRRGCVRHDQPAGLWLLRGRAWKGAVDQTGAKLAEGAERADPWVVIEPVARAVGVLEGLHEQPLLFPATLFTGRRAAQLARGRHGKARTTLDITTDISRFIEWVNASCQASGRPGERIPPDPSGRPLAPSRLRRTLAWFIVHRPRGLVAGAIQYGHVQVQVTLGYSKPRELHWTGANPQVARSDGASMRGSGLPTIAG